MKELNQQLRLIKEEDFIWLIYFFIVIFAYISNIYEKNYLITNNQESKKKFQIINRIILIVSLFIYLYFVLVAYKNLKYIQKNCYKKEVLLAISNLLASSLFLIAGIIQLYPNFNDSNNEDIAFL